MGVSISKVLNPEYDEALKVDETALYYRKLSKLKEEMTGWERVKAIFELDIYGEPSPQIMQVKDATFVSLIIGMAIGGIGRSRVTIHDFIRTNAHEKFETPRYAQKALQEKVMLGFGDGAWRVSWRLSAFTFMYMLATSCIAAYRGKSGILDQVGGAGTAGFLYKLRDGPKASIAGLVVGGGLGLVAGSFTALGLKMLGKEPEDLLQMQYQNIHARNKQVHDEMKARRHKDVSDDLTQFHEHFMADDELSMSKVKGTPINELSEGIKDQKFSPYPYITLPPAAIAEDVAAFEKERKERIAAEEAEKEKEKEKENEKQSSVKDNKTKDSSNQLSNSSPSNDSNSIKVEQ